MCIFNKMVAVEDFASFLKGSFVDGIYFTIISS